MDLGQWLAVCCHAAVCTALGGGCLWLGRWPRDGLLHNWAASYLTGQLLVTLLVLSTGFLPWHLPAVVAVAVVLAAITAAAAAVVLVRTFRRDGAGPALTSARTSVVLAVATMALFPHLLIVVHCTPPLEWDARSIWLFHGKAVYCCGGVTERFFADQQFWWSNLDYPLHIPAQAAVCATYHGGWDDQVARAFLLFDFFAFARLLLPTLRRRGHGRLLATAVTVLLLAQGVPSVVFAQNYISAQADYHYVTPIVLAALLLTTPGGPCCVPLVLVLLARAAVTKNEGMAYVGGAVLLAVGHGAWCWWRSRARPPAALLMQRHGRSIAFALLVGVGPPLVWGVWKRLHGVTGGLHLADRVMQPAILWPALAERSGTVAVILMEHMHANGTTWLAIAWLVLASVASYMGRGAGGGSRWRRHELVNLLGFTGAVGVVFATYVLTPHDVVYHMDTSAHRVLFLPHLLVFLACVFRLDALLAAHRAHAAGGVAAS